MPWSKTLFYFAGLFKIQFLIMYLPYILGLSTLIICHALAIISEPHTTKPPRRLQLQEGSVLLATNPSNVTSAKPENREAIHKPRQPLVVHPGKAKLSGSSETTTASTTTTTTTPRPTKLNTISEKPKIAAGYDNDGCIIAAEVPSINDVSRSSSQLVQTSPVTSSNSKVGISTIKGTTTVAPTTRAFRLLCPNPDGFFPYESDCSKFINCWKGRPHIQSCAPGTLFNAATSQCDHATAVSCQSAVTAVPKVAVQPTSVLLCPRANGYFPYESDCSKYINCWNGRPYLQSCAAGTLFNPSSSQCDHASSVSCRVAGSVDSRGANSTISSSLRCPKPNGLFPYDSDCSKFVNCWKGRPHVQSCALGTLFNSITLECDHASKVVCRVKKPVAVPAEDNSRHTNSSVLVTTVPIAPDSGQRMRLRGGEGPWEGYLEVREDPPMDWGYVCDSLGDWSVQDANVVCRSLGFSRGAKKTIQGMELGPLLLDRVMLNKIECNGTERNIKECKVLSGSDCMLHQQVVGVRCFHDPQGLCSEGEYSNGNSCYKIMKPVRLTRDEARTVCEKEGGHLLSIYSQAESDFITNLMMDKAPSIHTIHTDGVAVRVLRKVLFVWEHNEMTFNFTKWWPNWNKTITGNPDLSSKTECVVLSKRFRYQNGCATLPYFYWTLAECNEGAMALCKKKQRDIGCIVSNGAEYQGTANVSQSGLPCLSWADPRIRHVLITLSRAAVAFQENPSTNSNRSAALLGSPSHNYCRNPHGENQPWCFVSPYEMEYCDIPKCHIPGRGVLMDTSTQCKINQYKCTSSECIPNTWVCDGAKDCESGSDEAHCLHYLGEFTDRQNHSLHRHDVEKWMHTTLDTCARRCAEAKEFTCMSFNYNYGQEECILNDSNVGLSGDIAHTPGWIYYERRAYTVNCENDFECPSGKCINQTMVCDGKNDCGDKSDEVVCYSQLDFQIRLAGSNKSNEGRVEVKVFGQWGAVCDDQFGLNDANVICRQLGYHLGASQALSHSAFGPGSPILMDDLDCRGNETTLADCPFSGWGVHNCKPEETAGVRCIMAGAECSENQWQCESTGACIAIEFLCDTVDDCGDLSDENRTRCQSELAIRLVDGDDLHSGRVEIRHNGIWGTVCDDDFGTEDAIVICRMLGFAGPVQVIRDKFGAGRGPIWLDELGCSGTESNLLECSRLPWAKHNCRHSEDVGVQCSAKPSIQVSQIPNATVAQMLPRGKLPEVCGRRIVDDNPMDPLEQAAVAKIVKGEPTKPGAYPWQVGIRVKGSGRSDSVHWCGASVISEHYILTAAHCLEDFPKGLYVLRVGDYNTEDTDPEEDEFSIDRMWFHEDFNMGAHLNHDIAVIRIKTKGNRGIKFGSYVQPVCLPPANASYITGMNCTIAGWGSSGQPGSTFAIKLQSATVPLLQDHVCMAPYVYGVERIKQGMFCAGFLEGGVDACQGDSGGSLVCLLNGRPTLMGITSWGFGCGRPNRPGVYTRVTNYLPWIYSKMAIND